MLHSRPVVLIILIVTFDLRLCDRCSRRTALKLDFIHFGRQSERGEWPWHAAIFHQIDSAHPSYACGGTIVSRTFIITAAHCTYPSPRVRPLQASEILVRVGISNIRQLEDTFQEMLITKIFRHENYNTKTSYNDIALLQLVAELKFTDYVNSICLWRGNVEEDEIVGKKGYVPGWGKEENNLIPDILKLAVMPIVSRQACQESDPIFYTTYLYDRRTFCAGYRNGTSVAPGDSGSGLYIQINEVWLLRGIVSTGKRKSANDDIDTKKYIVFTDVAYYIQWIRTKINSQGSGGLDPIHVEECSVCGEKIRSPFTRSGFQNTRTWPWQAYILYNGTRMCSAVIISEYFVLSSFIGGQLQLFEMPIEAITAVFESDQYVKIATRQIDRVFPNISNDGKTYIVLWKMKIPLKCNKFLRPICLFREDPSKDESNYLTAYTSNDGVVFDNNICAKHFPMETRMMENYSFCYHNASSVDFTYIKRDKRWYLYGTPAEIRVYAEMKIYVFAHYISHYKDWIDTKIQDVQLNVLGIENCSPIEQFVYKIFRYDEFRCFATQITPGILITTAFCADEKLSNMYCQIEDGSKVQIDNVFLHPFYDKTTLLNNIALVQYCPSTTNASICIPRFSEKIANMSLPTGMGQHKLMLNIDTRTGTEINQRLVENLINKDKTNNKTQTYTDTRGWVDVMNYNAKTRPKIMAGFFSQNVTLTDTALCAQNWKRIGVNVVTDGSYICGTMPVKDFVRNRVCSGNLHGMPLLYSTPDAAETFLRGILDIGNKDLCSNDWPGDVYIDVTYYAQWIIEQVMNITEWCENKKDIEAASGFSWFWKKLTSIGGKARRMIF